jgi:hypothetical protein
MIQEVTHDADEAVRQHEKRTERIIKMLEDERDEKDCIASALIEQEWDESQAVEVTA